MGGVWCVHYNSRRLNKKTLSDWATGVEFFSISLAHVRRNLRTDYHQRRAHREYFPKHPRHRIRSYPAALRQLPERRHDTTTDRLLQGGD